MTILYWHWLVVGLVLIIAELLTNTLVSLALGVSALIVGLLVVLTDVNSVVALLVWLVLSVILTVVAFKIIRPKLCNQTTAGLGAGSIVGQTGMIVVQPFTHREGRVRFSVPVFGADEWPCRSLNDIALTVGERVIVVDVIGNELLVKSTQKNALEN